MMTTMRCVLFPWLLLASVHCWAQERLDYRTRVADPQANYYAIADRTDSLLKTLPPDTAWESQGLFFARWKWFWEPRMGDAIDGAKTGSFTHYAGVMKSMVQTPPCMSPSAYPANWNLLGPVQLPRQEMGWINAVALDPNDPSVAYAGAPNGGLWRTNDIGAPVPQWDNITDQTGLPGMGIGDILIDPSNSDIIYIATGYYTGSEITYGVGVMKTTNGTDPLPTWEFTGLSFNPFMNEIAAVKKLVMSPTDHNVIYAYTAKEVYRTTDAGATWASLGLNAAVNDVDLEINDVALDPLDNASLVVSLTKPDGFLWRWDSSAAQWTDLTTGLSATPHPYTNGIRFPVYFSRCNNDIYVLYKTSNDNRIDVSHDGGNSWSLDVISNNYGPWFVVSPANPDIMYLGDGSGRVIYKSVDGGEHLGAVSYYNGTYNGTSTHADIRALQLFQASADGLNDILLAGTDGGVLYSTTAVSPDGTVVNWKNANGSGLAVGQFYGLAGSEEVPERIIAGAQDNGVASYNSNTWTNKIIGDAYNSVIDHSNPDYGIVEQIYWGGKFRPTSSHVYLNTSQTGGASWTGSIQHPEWGNPANPDNALNGSPYSPDVWNVLASPIQIDHCNHLYIGFHDLFRFDALNNSWSPLSDFTAQDVPRGLGASAFAVAPSDHNVIYFGFEGQTWDPGNLIKHKLWVTVNGGATWSDITHDLPVNWYAISGIVVDPNNSDRVWVSFGDIGNYGNLAEPYNGSSRVYYSSDGGATWTDYSKGLTPLPINVIVHEQGSNDGLYVGTDVGVFYTNRKLYDADDIADPQNTGWVCFKDNLPACIVTDLEVNYASNRLRASTYGRGIWESSLACPLDADLYFATSTSSGLSNSFQEASDQLAVTADAGDIELFNFTGRTGSELRLSATGASGIHLAPSSHLFIHPCDGPGNSFEPKMLMAGTTNAFEEEESGADDLVVYPNPTMGLLTVRLRDADRDQVSNIRLFDGQGKLMLTQRMTGGLMTLDLPFPDGMYSLVVTHGTEVHSTRIILSNHD